jgi:hypothetical protein
VRRALKGLIDRGDVVVIGDKGGPGDPRCYATVESFTSLFEDKKVTDTTRAKEIMLKLADVMRGRAGGDVRVSRTIRPLHF